MRTVKRERLEKSKDIEPQLLTIRRNVRDGAVTIVNFFGLEHGLLPCQAAENNTSLLFSISWIKI